MSARLQPQLTRRAMGVRDLDTVVAVETRSYSHPWSRGNFTDSLAAGYLAEVLLAGDASVVGYFVAMTGVDELHLLNITVHPDWQSQGHGSGLLDAVERHAQHQRLGSLWLEVRQSNARARALYRQRGFNEVGLRRNYYPAATGREDAIVMRLGLAPHPQGLHAVD